MKHKRVAQQVLLVLASAALIFWAGRLSIQYEIHRDLPPLQPVAEINEKIPMIRIESIQNAKVMGRVNKPEIRIASGEQVAVPEEDLSFELDIQHLGYIGQKREVIVKEVPEWAKFVASKSGKYFYEIDERSLKQLSVQNQVYFATEEEAVKAGYEKRLR